jgi:hypothetical protein
MKEVLYPPPRIQRNEIEWQRQLSVALNGCVSTIRSATWSAAVLMQSAQKLVELSHRIPKLDYWKSDKMSVVIVTNRVFGGPGQPEFTTFIKGVTSLLYLQVQIVIRLTSSEESLVRYYNSLKVEFPQISVLYPYDVQNSFVLKFNPWLSYGLPLHTMQELGYSFHYTIDLLSQRTLNKDELRIFFVEFYGKKAMLYSPDVISEWDDFYRFVDSINNREGKHRLGLNRLNKEHRHFWIDMRKFHTFYATTSRRSGLMRFSFRSSRSKNNDSQCLRVEL